MKHAFLPLTFVLLFAACTDSQAPDSAVGTFTLQSVDGKPLPLVLDESGNRKEELTAGSLTFSPDATYTLTLTQRVTQAGLVTSSTETRTGTWTESGPQVRLFPSDVQTMRNATRLGDSLTLTDLNQTLVFRRRL